MANTITTGTGAPDVTVPQDPEQIALKKYTQTYKRNPDFKNPTDKATFYSYAYPNGNIPKEKMDSTFDYTKYNQLTGQRVQAPVDVSQGSATNLSNASNNMGVAAGNANQLAGTRNEFMSALQGVIRKKQDFANEKIGMSDLASAAGISGIGGLMASLQTRYAEINDKAVSFQNALKDMSGIYSDMTTDAANKYNQAKDAYGLVLDNMNKAAASTEAIALEMIRNGAVIPDSMKGILGDKFQMYKDVSASMASQIDKAKNASDYSSISETDIANMMTTLRKESQYALMSDEDLRGIAIQRARAQKDQINGVYNGGTGAIDDSNKNIQITNFDVNVPDYVPAQYKSQVESVAKAMGIPASLLAAQIKQESGWNPQASNINDKETSFGLGQINLKAHPEITKAQATNPIFAIGFVADRLKRMIDKYGVYEGIQAYNTPGAVGSDQLKKYANNIIGISGAKTTPTATETTPTDTIDNKTLQSNLGKLNSLFPKDLRESYLGEIRDAKGDKESIRSTVMSGLNKTANTAAAGPYQAANNAKAQYDAMVDFKNAMNEYISAGGKTSLLKGTGEQIKERLGTTSDEKLAQLNQRIQFMKGNYIRAMSGLAVTDAERAFYSLVFPGISKDGKLNTSQVDSFIKVQKDAFKNGMTNILGKDLYNGLDLDKEVATSESPTTKSEPVITPEDEVDNQWNEISSGASSNGIIGSTVNSGIKNPNGILTSIGMQNMANQNKRMLK